MARGVRGRRLRASPGVRSIAMNPVLRDGIVAEEHRYILAVGSATPVWTKWPGITEPPAEREQTGRPRTRGSLAPGAPRASTVRKVMVRCSPRWPSRVVRGSLASGTLLGLEAVVLSIQRGRRYLLATLAQAASSRYTIEQCFEEATDDVGLDHREVRTWSSWHRHITLGMMALAWLASTWAILPDEGCLLYARRREAAATDRSLVRPMIQVRLQYWPMCAGMVRLRTPASPWCPPTTRRR